MKGLVHKLLVAILTVALAVTMFPLPAFAVEGEKELQEKIQGQR